MQTPLPAAAVLQAHLAATAASASPATVRQRRWALTELFAFAQKGNPSPALAELLAPETVSRWLLRAASATSDQPAATTNGLRARASAARALARYAVAEGLLSADAVAALERACELPRPGRAAIRGADAVDQLLTAAAGARPHGVDAGVWDRFGAHVHLLVATGAPERVLTALTVDDLDLSARTVTLPTRKLPLDHRTWSAVATWLAYRADVVATLQGADPHRLWVRIRPAGDRHTAHTHLAGLPISERGLRLAYQETRDILAVRVPAVAAVEIRTLRAHHARHVARAAAAAR